MQSIEIGDEVVTNTGKKMIYFGDYWISYVIDDKNTITKQASILVNNTEWYINETSFLNTIKLSAKALKSQEEIDHSIHQQNFMCSRYRLFDNRITILNQVQKVPHVTLNHD